MVAAIIQARMNSSRLPGKVMAKLRGEPLISHLLNQVKKIKIINKIIVATTADDSDNEFSDYITQQNISVYRGSIDNVLDRYINCAKLFDVTNIVRICGDSPIIDIDLINEMVETLISNECDYVGCNPKLPCAATGFEAFTFNALMRQLDYPLNPHHFEHVSLFMRENIDFKKAYINPPDYLIKQDIRLTVDTQSDFDLVKKIFNHFNSNPFSFKDVIDYLENNPQIKLINSHIKQKDVKQKSYKVALIVKSIDNEIKENFKHVFTEKHHIGFEIIYVSLNDPNFDWSGFAKKIDSFDFVFYEKSIDNLTIKSLSQAVDLDIVEPENLAKLVKKELGIS
jgi:spore coat polysaccharide biosynthesis protein SpsF (cytidylyltransferase family)